MAFPDVAIRKTSEPTRARLLPDRWIVRLYDAQLQLVHTVSGQRIREGLAMAPALAAIEPDAADPLTAFLDGQGLDWMTRISAAVDAGMAVRIPHRQRPHARRSADRRRRARRARSRSPRPLSSTLS